MSQLVEWVRGRAHVLDTVGNSTVIGKGPAIGSACFQIFKGHVDFTLAMSAQNLHHRLKVSEFADLPTSESVTRCAGYKPNNVLSGLEHLRTHEYVGESLRMPRTARQREQCGSC